MPETVTLQVQYMFPLSYFANTILAKCKRGNMLNLQSVLTPLKAQCACPHTVISTYYRHTTTWPDMFLCTHCCWCDNSSKERTLVPVAESNASVSLRVPHAAMVLWIWCCRLLSFRTLGEKSPQIRTVVTDMKSSKSLLNQWILVIPSSNNYNGDNATFTDAVWGCTNSTTLPSL